MSFGPNCDEWSGHKVAVSGQWDCSLAITMDGGHFVDDEDTPGGCKLRGVAVVGEVRSPFVRKASYVEQFVGWQAKLVDRHFESLESWNSWAWKAIPALSLVVLSTMLYNIRQRMRLKNIEHLD